MAKLPPEKQRFLDEMKNLIEEEEKWLQEIVDHIGWNIEDFSKISDANSLKYELCPINNEHRVPEDSMEAHTAKCWKKHGKYPDAGLDVSSFINDSVSSSKTVDLSLLETSNESSGPTSQSSTSQCLIELLTAERDAKRRRATYRKKRVHTNKKSYNEVLRELIDNEMKTLEFGLKTEDESQGGSTVAPEERTNKNSVYAGIGNWIYHGNPYKRWMTIEQEERDLLENVGSSDTDFRSKHSTDSDRWSRENRREYSNGGSRWRERSRSDRRDERHRSDFDRRERSYSDRRRDPHSRRHQADVDRSEHRRHEERRRSEYSSRHSSVCKDQPKRERSSRRSPDGKRRKYCDDIEKVSQKSEFCVKLEPRDPSAGRESEFIDPTESANEKHSSKNCLKNNAAGFNDISKQDAEPRLASRRSSSLSGSERKRRKKKKKHKKKSKKKKKERSSSDSSS